MEWIADHLQLVIAIVIVAAYLLRAVVRKDQGAGGDESETGRAGPARPPHTEDPVEAERTRQIQEEIRRRILARQRGEPIAEPPRPPPLIFQTEEEAAAEVEEPEWVEEGPRPKPPPLPRPAPVSTPAAGFPAADAGRTAAILEQQRKLAEQLEAARSMRGLGTAGTSSIAAGAIGAASTPTQRASAVRRQIRDDLSGAPGLRRAVLLREILGEPPGLQRGPLVLPRK